MKAEFTPIDIIHNAIKDRHHFEPENVISEIEIYPQYTEGLESLESFSHIIVIFWLHKIKPDERSILKVHPRRDPSLPLTGVFATRSPARTNPIGVTSVRLINRAWNILTVCGLDAMDGTPVLDIKPYIPEDFSASEISLPSWVKKTPE